MRRIVTLTRGEALTALVLAREHENRVAFRNELTAVHRLLCGEHERPGPQTANFSLDRQRHARRLLQVANRPVLLPSELSDANIIPH